MRELADAERIRAFMRALGQEADEDCRIYFTGGASAVIEGWRRTTIDADILVIPDSDRLLQAIPALKERLRLNVELAAPPDFIPELPGWEARSRFIDRQGKVSYYHYDFYAQALAKIERGESKDLSDVEEMMRRGLVDPAKAWELFARIEALLYRYPDISPEEFRKAVVDALGPERPATVS